MDDSRFDTIVRNLANPSRRAVFSALTATLFGGALGNSLDAAEAKQQRDTRGKPERRGRRKRHTNDQDAVQASGKKKKKKKKRKKKTPTATSPITAPPPTGVTPPPGDPCDGVTCDPVENGVSLCVNGRCHIGCLSGFTLCDSACVDTKSHPTHCGTCGTSCLEKGDPICGNTGTCTGGVCQKAPVGTFCRPDSCIDGVRTSAAFCDGLGTCPPGQQEVCRTGLCSGNFCRQCVTHSDCISHWFCNSGGGCEPKRFNGRDCRQDYECESGFCVSGICCDHRTCGGTVPNGVASCHTGFCKAICAPGWGNCDGNITNGCETNVNPPGSWIDNGDGTCTQCDPGWGNCDGNPATGCETDLSSSPDHCGACGASCPTVKCGGTVRDPLFQQCVNGECVCGGSEPIDP